MVLFFSGTGNSRYAAKIIAMETGDELVSINGFMRRGGTETLHSDTPYVFVSPVHGWRLPEVVEDFIRKTSFEGSAKAYFVMTCGDGAGNAAKYCRKLCEEKGLDYRGLEAIVMPENYIALFAVPDKAEAWEIIRKAEPHIRAAADHIKYGRPLPGKKPGVFGRFESAVINPVFRARVIGARAFRTTGACTGCGRCVSLCPTNNIALEDGTPRWGKNCTHCMACISACPREAVEYGHRSKGKPRHYLGEQAAP
jgi:ferredoxin